MREAPTGPGGTPRWRTRVLALALGLVLSVVLLEVALQLGALGIRLASGGERPAWATRDLRVLCLGDSNTYGLWATRENAYPPRLERLWRERGGVPDIEVINLGVPGLNSSRLLGELPRILDELQPDWVVLMVGVNDFWTLPVAVAVDADEGAAVADGGWLRHSRVYQGLRMAVRLVQRGERREVEVDLDVAPEPGDVPYGGRDYVARYGDVEFEMGFERGATTGEERARLARNLDALVAAIEGRGSRVVLMSYPARFGKGYPQANAEIRRAAGRTGTPLVDLTKAFEAHCPEAECPDWLLPDRHPTARGYAHIAEVLADRLPELLGGSAAGDAARPVSR